MNKKDMILYGALAAAGISQIGCPIEKNDEIDEVKQEVWDTYGTNWFNSNLASEKERTTALEEMIDEYNNEVAKAAENGKLTSDELEEIGKFAKTVGKYDADKVPEDFKDSIDQLAKNYKDLKTRFDEHNSKDRIFLLMHKGKSIYGTTFSNIKKRDNSIVIDVDSGIAENFFGKDYTDLKEKAVEKIPLRYRTIDGVNDALDDGKLVRMNVGQINNLEKAAQKKDPNAHYISGKMDIDEGERGKLNSWYKRAGIMKRNFIFGEKEAGDMQVKYPVKEPKQ